MIQEFYNSIRQFLGEDWDAFLLKFRQTLVSPMPLLNKVNDYLLDHGGKQIRPMFTLLFARALGGVCNADVVSCAAASELLHTATLLHDDVADESPTRRGAMTVMSLYSPTVSVLVGDYWLSRVIDIVVDHHDKRVLKVFSKCLSDLAEGEMLQIEKAHNLDTTEQDYYAIIQRKTSSLFEAAILSSAYSVDADQSSTEAAFSYARHVGYAFQIMDDIFDYSPKINTGKPAGLDILERKITLPLLGAFRNAPEAVCNSIKEGIRTIDRGRAENLVTVSQVADFVREYRGIEYAREQLERECAMAVSSLDILPSTEAKDVLVNMTDLLRDRAF